MGDFRKRIILEADFEGKNILQGNTWRKISCTEKKYLSSRIMLENNLIPLSVSRGLR